MFRISQKFRLFSTAQKTYFCQCFDKKSGEIIISFQESNKIHKINAIIGQTLYKTINSTEISEINYDKFGIFEIIKYRMLWGKRPLWKLRNLYKKSRR